jgi:selenocysteine-specific elongation factor
MLAGAHGIDAVLLVVAADESVMPQTREHFHICRLLGIERGLVALTKSDLADAEALALARLEVSELVQGSFLEGRPVLAVSASTGEGLADLRQALLALATETPPRSREGPLRLPIDRVFSLRGFGTVVTGTLVSGALAAGDEVEVLPSGLRARVRGLHVHGASVEQAAAGTRTAANLAGVEIGELVRGDVLVRPGTLRPTSMIDGELSLLPGTRPLRDGARVRVHVASAEVPARVRLLGTEGLGPGEAALAQLRLERRAVAGRGDRLVLRSWSPAQTIGGVRVLDPQPPRRRRASWPAVQRVRDAASTTEAALAMIGETGPAGVEALALAARLTTPLDRLLPSLAASPAVVALGQGPVWLVSRSALEALSEEAIAAVSRFHGDEPLRPAMPREELRARVFSRAPAPAFEHVLSKLVSSRRLQAGPEGLARPDHAVRLAPEEDEARVALLRAAEAAGLAGVETRALAGGARRDPRLLERIAHVLVREGSLARIGDALLVHTSHLDAFKAEVRRRFPPGERLEVVAIKQLTGLSRKFVIPLLEYLDRERVTRRSGADRVVLR